MLFESLITMSQQHWVVGVVWIDYTEVTKQFPYSELEHVKRRVHGKIILQRHPRSTFD